MPKRASPKSLLDLCFDNVTSKIFAGQWCNSEFVENGDHKKRRLDVVNPFEDIPSILVENILCTIDDGIKAVHFYDARKDWPVYECYEILFTPGIRILHLTKGTISPEEVDIPYSGLRISPEGYLLRDNTEKLVEDKKICRLISLASIKCPKLTALKLRDLSDVPEKDYMKFLREFTKLQILDLSHSSAGNDCMQILGTFCKDLRVLDITYCPVADAGIKGLCGVDDFKTGNENGCKFIHTLRISNTKISKIGIRFALENLPALQCFDCCSSVQVLAEMHRAAFERNQSNLPHYSLINFNFYVTDELPYVNGSLGLAASLCYLSVVKVDINIVRKLTDTDLLGLLVLKRLEELVIRNVNNCRKHCRITFDGGIAPLLKAVGKSLKELGLYELGICVNIRTIAEFCPDLRFLSLCHNSSYTLAWPEEAQPVKMRSVFQKMETIHLFDGEHFFWHHQDILGPFDTISSEILLLLLSSPVLKDVYISSCVNLNDDILRKSADIHGFHHLEQLKLGNTISLTKKVIDDIFMNENNPLKLVILVDCDLLRNEHFEEWQKLIDEKKWGLQIEQCDPDYPSLNFY